MTNTRTLEPRAYYVGALNAFTTSKDEAEKMGKQFPVESLYPAAAYEALQKENAELRDRITIMDEAAKYYNGTIIGISNKLHAENEALKLKKEFIEYAAQDLENQNEALKAENEALRFKALAAISPRVKQSYEREIKGLEDQIEAQARRIAELEEHITKLGSGSRQHLYQAFARRYREILSLRRENEALRKQVDDHEEWHMMRDEMRKALEAQMNGDSK